jgi:phosphatidylinositol alpha-1,6-mannosyltransferase
MKICYLTDNINPRHGGGRHAGDLISAVKKSGHEVIILTSLKSGLGLFFSALKVRKYLKHCDIIHALDGYPHGIIAALANFGLKKRLIITVLGTHAVVPLYSFPANVLLKWAYKKADKVISISHFIKNELLKAGVSGKIEVINPGINFNKFYKEHLDSDESFIISVGALKNRKGYHISIPAFALAKKSFPDLKYKIVGSQEDGAYFNRLKELTVKYNVQNDVEFLSGLSDEELSDLYRKAKLFILTSVNEKYHFEGFGLVFLEAAAAGLSVIGTLNNGIEDAVKNNYNGILVEQNDIKNTAQTIVSILKDKDFRKKLSSNSFNWAKSHDWSEVVLKYLKVYKQ